MQPVITRGRLWSYVALLVSLMVMMAVSGDGGTERGECSTPAGLPGRCVPVRECEYARDILRRRDHHVNDTLYVEKLQCGARPDGLPLVCCPRLTNDALCGAPDFSSRIMGGNETSIVEYPWLVMLRFQARRGIASNCAGALIGGPFVLTAAHCLTEAKKHRWTLHSVMVSEWNFLNRSGRKECTTVTVHSGIADLCRKEYKVARYTLHPNYTSNYMVHTNDIALIELVSRVELNRFVRPICLPLEAAHLPAPEGQWNDYIAAGWGATSAAMAQGGAMSRRLMDVYLRSFDSARCSKLFPVPSGRGIGLQHVCAGGSHGQDTCRGDSGGPLMQDHGGVTYLVGITSFGAAECGKEGMPGVYTNVSHMLDWIQDEVFRRSTV